MRKLASIQRIKSLEPIEGKDRIELCTILGWDVIVQKGEFKEGDLVVYCEYDTVLPIKPEFEFCDQGVWGNNTQRIVSTIFDENTLKEILEATAEYQRQDRSFKALQQEVDINQTSALLNLSKTQTAIEQELKNLKESTDNSNSVIIFQSIFILSILFLGLGTYVLFDEKKRTKISKKLGLHKGEKTWS